MINSQQIQWMNYLRATATTAVVILHVTSSLLNRYSQIPMTDWWVGNLVDGSVRFCVPIFLMLTGALLLPKTYEISDFLKKKFLRIVLPFIFWTCIYITYSIYDLWLSDPNTSLLDIAKLIFLKARDGASFHLWYIYMVIGLYLFIPILSKWVSLSTKKEIIYFLSIWCLTIILGLPKINQLKPDINLVYFSGYIGYIVLGYYLATRLNSAYDRILSIALIGIGLFITVIGTYLMTKHQMKFYGGFYSYLSPNVIVTSIGVFLLFKSINFNNILASTVNLLSKYSYGIYLSHMLVLIFLSKLGINSSFINPLIGIPVTTAICLLTSLFITYLISKTRYGSLLSG